MKTSNVMIDDAFWLRYLRAHAEPRTRRIHVAATTLASVVFVAGIVRRDWRLTAAALICGYMPAWYAHGFIECNRPETFSAPLRSLASDYRMWWLSITRRLDAELDRAEIKTRVTRD